MKIGDLVNLNFPSTKKLPVGIIMALPTSSDCFQVFWNNTLQWIWQDNLEVINESR